VGWFRRKAKDKDTAAAETLSSTQRAASLLERGKLGYKTVCGRPLRTLEGDGYQRILENPDAWARLQERMDAYFDYAIEIFPYRAPAGTQPGKLTRPKRFFVIQREMIETCFPGGRQSGEPGDSDLRDLLAALQLSFRHNLRHYYLCKRLVCELAAVCLVSYFFLAFLYDYVSLKNVVCAILPDSVCQNGPPPLSGWVEGGLFIVTILAVVALSWLCNWLLHTLLLGALNVSCLFVDGQAAIRSKNLTNLIDDVFPRIDSDRYILEKTEHRREWPERSKKWSVLIYWLAKRLEYIERFVQVEIWLMRREHYWMNRTALAAFLVVTAGWLAYMAWLGLTHLGLANLHDAGILLAYLFAVAAGCTILGASYTMWNTPLTLVEDRLQPANWMRYRDIHLHEKFARQIGRDQSEILDKEDQLAGH
jgi:hypothetical protein